MAKWMTIIGRILGVLAFVALSSAWCSQVMGTDILGMSQDHLFNDAKAMGILGIFCLVDGIVHARESIAG